MQLIAALIYGHHALGDDAAVVVVAAAVALACVFLRLEKKCVQAVRPLY